MAKRLPTPILYKVEYADEPNDNIEYVLFTTGDCKDRDPFIRRAISNPDFHGLQFTIDLVKTSYEPLEHWNK